MITVEDVNTIINSYGLKGKWHIINTGLLGDFEYEDAIYDFCKIKHIINGSQHTFEFSIKNSNFSGLFYLMDENDNIIKHDNINIIDVYYKSGDNDTICVETTLTKIKIVCYCTSMEYDTKELKWTKYKLENNLFVNQNAEDNYVITPLESNITPDVSFLGDNLCKKLLTEDGTSYQEEYFVMELKKKKDFVINIENVKLANGIINEIEVISEGIVRVKYLNKEYVQNLEFNNILKIDLTGYYNLSKLDVEITLLSSNEDNTNTFNYTFEVVPVTVNNYNELIVELAKGTSNIYINDDITLANDILLNNNLVIRSDNKIFNMNGYSFIVEKSFRSHHLQFENGSPVFIQKENSTIELYDCTFTHNNNGDKNNLGSVISCDIDIDSLDIGTDFTTTISGCKFFNNHNCILHGGDLTVIDCEYVNDDMDYVNAKNSAFLYQIDGSAIITDSNFRIDYGEQNNFDNENIMYGQSLFMCGETASINNANHDNLNSDNKVNWHNYPYSNTSYLYCRYLYPNINEIVYSKPIEGKEQNCMCYAVSGVDWVYKENVKIERLGD